jgi:hypothetical protein
MNAHSHNKRLSEHVIRGVCVILRHALQAVEGEGEGQGLLHDAPSMQTYSVDGYGDKVMMKLLWPDRGPIPEFAWRN